MAGNRVTVGPARWWADRAVQIDTLVLMLVVVLSAAPYVAGLGFYSDDWDLFFIFESAAREGISPITRALSYVPARPVQALYLAGLFEVFGRDPLGYHVINTAVIALSIALLYLLLLRLGASRSQSFASTMIFALLPQLSTVRVWFAAFQIPLAMLFMLASMHALMFFRRTGATGWAVAATAAAALSIASYETFAPLLAGFAAALLIDIRSEGGAVLSSRRSIAPLMVLGLIALGFLLKLTSERAIIFGLRGYLHELHQLVRGDYDWRTDYSLNVFAAIEVHFWLTLRSWSTAAIALFTGRAGAPVAAAAAATAVLTFWRLRTAVPRAREVRPKRLLLLGLAAFVLGHAMFFIVPDYILFSPSGIANRLLVPAAIGVGIIFAALAQLASDVAPAKWRQTVFSACVAAITVAAVARLELLEQYWVEAPDRQKEVLEAARSDLKLLPAGSTVILDGVCPYHGPAVVLESYWEISGALSHALGRTISGDVVSPRMSLGQGGLTTSIYEEPKFYRYGPTLYAYNPSLHLLVRLEDAAAAKQYFSRHDRKAVRCDWGEVGHGAVV